MDEKPLLGQYAHMKRPLPNADNAREILAQRRTRPAIRPPPRIGSKLKKVLAPLQKKFGPGISQLQHHWVDVVGERLAMRTKPDTIKRQNHEQVLVIACDGAAASLIEHQSQTILSRANQFLGDQTVTRIRVIQTKRPAPQRKPYTPKPHNIDPSLEGALNRLDKVIKDKHNQNQS